ncbi:MAG: hypothetical protein J6C99_05860 [Lachnospiraceae bacterium]|nr:hypothetical protein [Lachnospiraceae bacterium]
MATIHGIGCRDQICQICGANFRMLHGCGCKSNHLFNQFCNMVDLSVNIRCHFVRRSCTVLQVGVMITQTI